MRKDTTHAERPVLLDSGAIAGQAEATAPLPRFAPLRARVAIPWTRVRFGRLHGRLALATLVVASVAVVMCAASGPSVLVPGSTISFPNWEAGPLHGLIGRPLTNATTIGLGWSAVLLAMLAAYGVALASVRALSMRAIAVFVVALHAILLLSPPLQLNDVFNYLGYARLGALHHINPYQSVIASELHDPVFGFTSWHNLPSPYGQLFTALTYPLAFLSLPVAYWTLKVVTVLSSLAFIALVWRCALLLGRDPRFAVLFVAANPIFLMYEVAGFHNDFLMLIPMLAAIMLMRARRDRAAGAAVTIAVVVKFSALVLLPFLLVAACPAQRRIRILTGAALAAIPLVALSLALFGLAQPNLADQSTLLTDWSIPNVVGLALGVGGTPVTIEARGRRARAVSDLPATSPARPAGRFRLGDARADHQPGLAGAMVRGLAAAARGPRHECPAAAGGGGDDDLSAGDVHAGDGDRDLALRLQPDGHTGRTSITEPAAPPLTGPDHAPEMQDSVSFRTT